MVLFGPVKPELGVIPSGAEHLNFPGRELNVIDFTEQYFFKEKKPKTSYFRIINLFPSCFFISGVNQKHKEKYNRSIGSEEVLLYFSLCFWFTPEMKKQDGNKFIILK